ncbi:hypothetical protein [Dactylosporangium matsuzakiense]|uniref:Zinc-binding dehydrogenase n=2 Tax=Dactylosporangium matsuzakiense TaxID=53360 RepID=A0A9W6NL93_9ACTN|nr:hypothetical protein [Dactylosporangium matsuzakiense]GLL01109.1 hypothetical protein GCM10017581_028500 [Dactylosporangium matsuzakiense]
MGRLAGAADGRPGLGILAQLAADGRPGLGILAQLAADGRPGLGILAQLAADGRPAVPVEAVLGFAEAAAGRAAVEGRHRRGKLVVAVE